MLQTSFALRPIAVKTRRNGIGGSKAERSARPGSSAVRRAVREVAEGRPSSGAHARRTSMAAGAAAITSAQHALMKPSSSSLASRAERDASTIARGLRSWLLLMMMMRDGR